MTGQSDSAPRPSDPARNLAGLVVANSSLILAVLVYMGWAYDSALYGHFHLSPLDLGFGPQEYALRSLSLFSTDIVIAAVVLIAIVSVRAWGELGAVIKAIAHAPVFAAYRRLSPVSTVSPAAGRGFVGFPPDDPDDPVAQAPHPAEQERRGGALLVGGAMATIAALVLYWSATYASISTFLILCLLGGGPLLLTWPTRDDRPGRGARALAIVFAAICVLWAASVYAEQQGTKAAENLVRNLQTSTQVVVYSMQQLPLRGPGVNALPMPPGFPYHYRYTGLRLLLIQSGTYYLLPVGWSSQFDLTYIINESAQTSLELY